MAIIISKYWRNRYDAEKILLNKYCDKVDRQLKAQYKRKAHDIINEMINKYQQILIETANGDVLASHLYQYNRYVELLAEINKQLRELGENEIALYNQSFLDMYEDNAKLIGKQFNKAISIDFDNAKQVVDKIWCSDGKHWSARIWRNQAKLAQSLTNSLIDAVVAGHSVDRLTEKLMKDMSVDYYRAKRIAVTELARVENDSTIEQYKQFGVKKVRILTANDEKVCTICKENSRHEYEIGSEPMLPNHCWCRCVLTAVLDEENEQ